MFSLDRRLDFGEFRCCDTSDFPRPRPTIKPAFFKAGFCVSGFSLSQKVAGHARRKSVRASRHAAEIFLIRRESCRFPPDCGRPCVFFATERRAENSKRTSTRTDTRRPFEGTGGGSWLCPSPIHAENLHTLAAVCARRVAAWRRRQ